MATGRSWSSCHLAPAPVILQVVDGQSDQFDAAFAELAAQPGHSTQLRGANRGVIFGVGEQDTPSVGDMGILETSWRRVSGAFFDVRGKKDKYLTFERQDVT